MFSYLNPLFILSYPTFFKLFHTSTLISKNHYEVLNLARSCSTQDIKDSFIKLSKKYHPDLNRNKDAHKKFLAINEAYKVLSNPQARHLYDLGLVPHRKVYPSGRPHIHRKWEAYQTDPWKDPSFYENRDKSRDKYYEAQPYYGIRNVKKVSNLTIVAVCLVVATIGVGLQVVAIRKSFAFHKMKLDQKSAEAEKMLNDARQAAQKNGNELQVELLKERLARRNRID